jgi:ABC-type transport system involved in multi-copper enzyme maturation permease subunit
MLRTTRSELTRMRRRSFLGGWLGITAVFAMLFNTFVFSAAADGTDVPDNAPGGGFPTLAQLVQPDGLIGGLTSGATMFGVVTLSYWAIATAGDYSTGLIRLLVQAEPRRVRLLAGKVLALTVWTAAAATIATALSVGSAPLIARAVGVSTGAWGADVVATILGGWVNTFLALLVWGVIGLVIAVVARSSAAAIAVGVAYVLVVEALVKTAAEGASDWLPGSTLSALAHGGNATIAYATAILLGAGYATIGLASAAVTFARREVTD